MVCQNSNPLSPANQDPDVGYPCVSSVMLLPILLAGCNHVASHSLTSHVGCDEYIGTFHSVDGDCCTFNTGAPEYSGKCVTHCNECEEEFIYSTELARILWHQLDCSSSCGVSLA